MQVENGSELATKNQMTVERKSDREVVITRTFNAPATIVFDAWTKPELMMRWWAPRSTGMKLISCEIDLRVGGKYRLVFAGDGDKPDAFYGKYMVVERPTRLVWTDDDLVEGSGQNAASAAAAEQAVSTLTLVEKHGKTTLTLHQLFPSKEALDRDISGMEHGMRETLGQLEELLAATKKTD
jgi:uncharacterized protein YndB with AHSA1/START domain